MDVKPVKRQDEEKLIFFYRHLFVKESLVSVSFISNSD